MRAESLSDPACVLSDADRQALLAAMEAGCRVFALYDRDAWAGWMLVGRKYSLVNRECYYPVPSDARHIVNLAVEVEPRCRGGKAAGFLKEAVMLQLKVEGFERVLGRIGIVNHSSLVLDQHLDSHQVRRVRVQRMFGIRWATVLGAECHTSLQRPKREPRGSHAQA